MENGQQTTDNGLLTVDYLTTLEIRGEIIMVSRKKNKFFYRLTGPVFTGGVGVLVFLKTDEKEELCFL